MEASETIRDLLETRNVASKGSVVIS